MRQAEKTCPKTPNGGKQIGGYAKHKRIKKKPKFSKIKLQVNVDICEKESVNPLLRKCWLDEIPQKQMLQVREARGEENRDKRGVKKANEKEKNSLETPKKLRRKNVAKKAES